MTNRREFLSVSIAGSVGIYSSVQPTSLFAKTRLAKPINSEEIERFFKAIKNGSLPKCQEMLDANKRLLESRNPSGHSAYGYALIHGKKDIAQLLAETGYKSDLHEAALALDWNRFNSLADALGDNSIKKVNEPHPIGGSAMYCAAVGGAGSDIWRVYAQCGDPDRFEKTENAEAPIQAALRYRDLNTAEMTAATLLSNSASPNPRVGDGHETPLHIAAKRESADLVELLISCGAEIGAKDAQGKTALDVAQTAGNKSIIKLIENHDSIPRVWRTDESVCDVNGDRYELPDWKGVSLKVRGKLVGASHGNLTQIKSLVGRDRRLAHSVATTGERAVEAGAHMGNKSIVEFLLRNGAPYSLPTAVMMGDLTTVKRMLNDEPKCIHERGAHFFALLWYPIIGRCNIEMTEFLLEKGAKVEQQHFLGTTALHWAAMNDQLEVAEILIASGANVNRVGRKFGGRSVTPLQQARSKKMKTLLKSNGAK